MEVKISTLEFYYLFYYYINSQQGYPITKNQGESNGREEGTSRDIGFLEGKKVKRVRVIKRTKN